MVWFANFISAKADPASAAGAGPSPERRLDDAAVAAPGSVGRHAALAAAGLALLHLSHPLTWQIPLPAFWFPPLGIGLVLLVWLGPRALGLVLVDACLVHWQAWARGLEVDVRQAALEVLLSAAEVWTVWWCYHRLTKSSGGFTDPRSTIRFLLFGPGLSLALFAVAHALTTAEPVLTTFALVTRGFWLSRALGLLVWAPPLLVVATPTLIQRGLAIVEPGDEPPRGDRGGNGLCYGDFLEMGGLALGTGILGFLLVVTHGRGETLGRGLWMLPLFLIGWASFRQGVSGGTIVAATGAIVSCTLASQLDRSEIDFTMVQCNLLAHCSMALLMGVSASWIAASEARYRQVVSHIPVVLYSARLRPPSEPRSAYQTVVVRFVSPACKQLLGCDPEELLGDYERWLQRVHRDDRELLGAAQAQLSRSGQPVTCEYRLAASNERGASSEGRGTSEEPPGLAPRPSPLAPQAPVRWVRDTLVPLFGTDGQLEGWEGVVAEITEQRMLADDLRRTTSMFYALVTHLPAGVFFVHAPSGRPILVNARARQLLGQRENLAAGLNQWAEVYRLYRPDGTPYPADELPVCTALRRGVTSMRDDIVVHRPDGRRVPLVTWAAPIDLGGRGKADAAVWVLEDLTAVHQAEAARRDSEARLRTVIETMAEGLIVYDRTGQIVECNPAACAILGLAPEQLRGRSLRDPDWEHLGADGTPFPREEHPALVSLRTGEPVRNVILGVQSPEVRWLLVNAMPLTEGRNLQPARVVTTVTDITAHRQALEVLKASEEKYRGLVETLPLMLLQCDREWRVSYINPAVSAITGYDLDDLRDPASWQALLHPDDLPRVLTAQPEILAGQTARLEIRFQTKHGAERSGYAIAQPRWQANEVAGITIMIIDMTLQRRLEQELQRAQRLELVGRLASGIAHDFNNLLTVVITLADMARHQLPADHTVREDLRRVVDAGEQAARLAGQLLAFSKQRRIVARRIDINQVVRQTLDLLRATLPRSITVEPSLQEPELYVQADETQLQQVLMNLCLNARDAMPTGGCLEVHTEAVLAHGGHGSSAFDWVRLSIRDSGHGMPDSVRARIFDPFFSTKEQGTGLGLAVVQQIVESYGGRVEVWSHPGEGARFDVWLPRSAAEVENLKN